MANPFLFNDTDDRVDTSLPLLMEIAMDFKTGSIILDANNKPKIVTENEALKVWIYKTLKTERYRYNAYLHDEYLATCNYGVELEHFIGTHTNNEESANEIKKYIYEGLMVNPYIININSIDITQISHFNLQYHIELTSIYGEVNIVV